MKRIIVDNDKLQKKVKLKEKPIIAINNRPILPKLESEVTPSTSVKLNVNPKHICPICGTSFQSKKGLARHKVNHNKIKIPSVDEPNDQTTTFNCEFCFKVYKQSDPLIRHQKLFHSNSNHFICIYCNTGYLSKDIMIKHITTDHPDLLYECFYCKGKFQKRRTLLQHHRLIHKLTQTLQFCGYCKSDKFGFTSENDLITHQRKFHEQMSDGQSIITINDDGLNELMNLNGDPNAYLDVEFLDDDDCFSEYLLPLLDQTPIHDVTVDGAVFIKFKDEHSKEIELLSHPIDEIDPSDKTRLYNCPKCSSTFNKLNNLTKHLAHDHDVSCLICNECGAAFNRHAQYELHCKNHTQEKCDLSADGDILFCSLCDKKFKTLSGFKYHLKTHTGVKSFPCQYCDKKFPASTNLNSHLKIVHSQFKQYECNLCEQKFATNDHLRKHIIKHTQQRKFLCFKCGKKFYQKSHLNEHMWSHTDVKKYQCDSCDSGYTSRSSLKQHLLNKHS